MSRIIIDNRSSKSDERVIEMVSTIVAEGRVSNDGRQYCYVTVSDGLAIASYLNKKSDRFVAYDDEGAKQ